MRNRLIILAITCLLFTLNLNAEGINSGNTGRYQSSMIKSRGAMTDYSVGAWLGANYTNFIFSGKYHLLNSMLVKTNYNTTFAFGIGASYMKSAHWSYQVELNFDVRGMNYTDDFFSFLNGTKLTNTVNSDLRLNYYTLPVMFKYQFGRVSKWYVTGGAYVSSLKSARIKGEMKSQIINNFNAIVTKTFKLDYYISATYQYDAGVLAGIGYMLPLQKGPQGAVTNMIFDFRYYQGIANVFAGDQPEEIDPFLEINPNIEVIIEDPLNSGLNIKTSTLAFKIGILWQI